MEQDYNDELTLLTEEEVSKLIKFDCVTLRQWRAQNKGLKFCRIHRNIRYRLKDVKAFINSSLCQPQETHNHQIKNY